MTKNYLEFGILKGKLRKPYEIQTSTKISDLYDAYMFSRYFNDIFILNTEKKLPQVAKSLHDSKDLRFSFVIYLLLIVTRANKYYEFGSTIFERYFFIKFFEKIFFKKAKMIKYYGNDISEFFNYFSNSIFKKLFFCKSYKRYNKKSLKSSIFFSKGISLLYEKKNNEILKHAIKNSKCGFFDFSVLKREEVRLLNTGKKLYYIDFRKFIKLISKIKSKKFYFRNLKKKGKKMYFECVFGNEKLLKKYFAVEKKFRLKKSATKYIGLGSKFKNTSYFIHFFEKNF